MTDQLRLPPLDTYRLPFVQPLGHLIIVWARLEMAVVRFFGLEALSPIARTFSFDWEYVETAKEFRHWSERLDERTAELVDPQLRQQVKKSCEVIKRLRIRRNRLVHDTIEVGIFQEENGGLEAKPFLGPNLQLKKWDPDKGFCAITPEYVADLACLVYEAALDFEDYANRLPKEATEDDGVPIFDD